jgi:hypothetical protein
MTHEFKNKPWNFKEEAIKYCQLDCKSLHELMGVFNNLIMKQFNVNVSKCLTIGALAMRIFKSNFMPSFLSTLAKQGSGALTLLIPCFARVGV